MTPAEQEGSLYAISAGGLIQTKTSTIVGNWKGWGGGWGTQGVVLLKQKLQMVGGK